MIYKFDYFKFGTCSFDKETSIKNDIIFCPPKGSHVTKEDHGYRLFKACQNIDPVNCTTQMHDNKHDKELKEYNRFLLAGFNIYGDIKYWSLIEFIDGITVKVTNEHKQERAFKFKQKRDVTIGFTKTLIKSESIDTLKKHIIGCMESESPFNMHTSSGFASELFKGE